jgi:hypothetical protein
MDLGGSHFEPLNVPGLDVYVQACPYCRHLGSVVTRRVYDRLTLFCPGCENTWVAAERRRRRSDRRQTASGNIARDHRTSERRREPKFPREIY